MKKILITPRSLTKNGHPELDRLSEEGYGLVFSTPGKLPSEDEIIKRLPGCVGYLAGVEKLGSNILESAKELSVISRNGTGIDNIDLDAAERSNIRICKTEGANARGVAELTVGLIFSLLRAIPFHDQRMKTGLWQRRKAIELENSTLGLLGCGKIGRHVARLALGLGMRVSAYDLKPDTSFSPGDHFQYVSLENLLANSDIISLHRPGSPSSQPEINGQAITMMRKGVYLVNTSRASLLDETAVFRALEKGHIAGLAMDVYHEEPPKDYRLIKHDRVIATPHIGGFTRQSILRATRGAVDNLLKYL
jgi:D-3-phosphoglycerate dehydrogenase